MLEKEGKTLVILGESHIKLPIAARAGEEVLRHFPVRVLEGARLPGTGDVEPVESQQVKDEHEGADAAYNGDLSEGDKKQKGGIWGAYFNLLHNIKEMSGGFLEGSTIHLAESQKGQTVKGMEVVIVDPKNETPG